MTPSEDDVEAGSDVSGPLLDLLRDLMGRTDLQYRSPPVALTGGHSAQLFAFDLDEPAVPLVLRLIPPTGDAEQEIAVHRAVADAGYPAPTVRFSSTDPAALGRPFLVMSRVPGRTPLASAGITGLPRLFRTLPTVLADLMADLHDIPTGGPGVFCHGDLHGENLLVQGDEVTAVIDWELASIGPAAQDVARTHLVLATLPGVSGLGRRLLARSASALADRFVTAYEERRPVGRDEVDEWRVAHARRLIGVAQGTGTVADQWRPTVPALEAIIARGASGDIGRPPG